MNKSKLYNVIFPLWMAFFMTQLIFLVIFGNLLIDGLVIYLTLKINKVSLPKDKLKLVILKAWGFGFIADIFGAGLLLVSSTYLNMNLYRIWNNGMEIALVLIVVLLAGLLIGLLNYWISRQAGLSEGISRRLAFSMGTITAPWMFLIPTPWV